MNKASRNARHDAPPTHAGIPLSELINLALLGAKMRNAQRHDLAAARRLEREFDAAIEAALERERPSLPFTQ